MPMTGAEIEARIREALPDARVELTPLADDGDHWAARVVSREFEGKSRVRQHQMVYAAFGADMGVELHALQLETVTPEKAQMALTQITGMTDE